MPHALLAPLTALVLVGGATRELAIADWDELEARYACRKKESPAACARRLRQALRDELAKPKLALAMPALGCSSGPVGPCGVSFDGCTPLAGVIVSALERLGRAAEIALPELKLAGERSVALTSITRRARAAAGDSALFEFASRQLGDAQAECRWEGAGLLGALRTPQAIARLAGFGHSGPWADRRVAANALAFADPGAVAALVAMLDVRQPVSVLLASAVALQTIGAPARGASPRLLQLALDHWSGEVRSAAAAALRSVDGTKVVARPDACARFDGGWTLGPGAVSLGGTQLEPGCSTSTGYWQLAVKVDETCILGVGRGEWGGRLAADGQEFFAAWHTNPVRLVRLGGRNYLIQAMHHRRPRGEIDELIHDASGWRVEFVTDLPGAPVEMKLDEGGRLLLLTEDGSIEPHCRNGMRVRFDPGSGSISLLP